MSEIIGYDGALALIQNGENSVAVDTELNVIVDSGLTAAMKKKRKWSSYKSCTVSAATLELANGALSTLSIKVITASGRLYTIPSSVKDEAKKGLEWRKENKRGGTAVGVNTARTLAKGGQIGIEKVRHIAKYFPRHEVDKKAKGYEPGEDNFPSNGRIAWALWGGDAGWRWAKNIVERENKKALTADGYALNDYYVEPGLYDVDTNYDAVVDDFRNAIEADNYEDIDAPEFMVRVRMDGSGMDRLYKVDTDGRVYVWDDGCWDDLGHLDGDIYTYDKALDDPYDRVEKDYFVIDPESAIVVSAIMQQNPDKPVSIFDVDSMEASLAERAADQIDLTMVDYSMVAATAPAQPSAAAPEGDGKYTPEERSKNALSQPRNAAGLFAKAGTSVSVEGGKPGVIQSIDKASKTATVQHADGTSSIVPVNMTRPAEVTSGVAQTPQQKQEPLDVSGIIGEPRTPTDRGNAQIPGTLPALTPRDLGKVIADWPAWVSSARQESLAPVSSKPGEPSWSEKQAADSRTPFHKADMKQFENDPVLQKLQKLTGVKLTLDAYKHPLLKNWLNAKGKNNTSPNAIWYQPVTGAGPATENVALSPETSDVPPLFMALVSPDDPRAVMDVVALVPAGTQSTDPVAFIREDRKWVKSEQVMNDLRSATPPPVVPLDADALASVMEQTDDVQEEDKPKTTTASAFTPDLVLMVLFGPNPEALRAAATRSEEELNALAAGARPPSAYNIDKNKGNAEKLRRYWVRGKGAAKIRWGEGGDWKRCVRYLSKYLGTRAKGYCQLRHKEATGMYTSTHAKLIRGRNNQVTDFIMEEVLTKNYGKPTIITDEDMLTPIEAINAEQDDLYDNDWMPEAEIESLLQDEGCNAAMTAAGGTDRNRGQAEELRRYWTTGKGGMKIRWNTPGDWTRCVRNLSKYLGNRAKGYCALRHHEMTGEWTGEQRDRKLEMSVRSFDEILDIADLNARAHRNMERLGMIASSGMTGSKFCIPLVIPEEVESGDGRSFKKDSITTREFPLPLMWQIKTGDGHQGSVVVGRIDTMERIEGGIGNAYGVFDSGAYGREAERMVREGFLVGVSADMDRFEATEKKPKSKSLEENSEATEDEQITSNPIIVSKARIMGVTIVPKPAFQECKIVIVDDEENNNNNQEDSMIPDGIYVDDVDALDAEALVACGYTAGAIPMTPPKSWFENPKLNKPTPLTVDDDGRVYGHIAAWHVDHIGMAFGTRPPRSKSNYAYFQTGVCRTEEGIDVPVGQLTLAGGHASIEASAAEAVKHYDDTASSFADVAAGEDAYGIWVSGALRPGTTPEQIRAIRASAPSGDWRPIKGSLELVAVCQVNVPGFPIARARVASGHVMALVAAGAATLAKMKTDPIAELTARVNNLEQFGSRGDLAAKVSELATRVNSEAYFEVINQETRMKLAEKGHAMPDGSYPIRNVADLKNAIHAYGRAPVGKEKAVKDLIIKRAKDLKKPELIPDKWQSPHAKDSLRASAEDLKARVAAAQEALGKASAAEFATEGEEAKYTFETQPRDSKGKFRKVLAVLKENLGAAGLEGEFQLAKKVEMLNQAGHYVAASRAATQLLDTVERMRTGALNNDSLENIKLAATQLGTTVANSPLPFGHDTKKMRFTDLPVPLQKLTQDMMDRVEKRIGKDEAVEANKELRSYISGGRLMTQSNISAELSKMLRLLT